MKQKKQTKKQKRLNRIRRKRIWPSVVTFCAFLVLCFFMVGLLMQLFVTFVIGSKIEQLNASAIHTAKAIEEFLLEGESITEAADKVREILPNDSEIYITDDKGQKVYGDTDSVPLTNYMLELEMDEAYDVIADSKINPTQLEFLENPVNMMIKFAMQERVDMRNRHLLEEWRRKEIIDQNVWVRAKAAGRYDVFCRVHLNVNRREVFGVVAIALATSGILFLLVIYQFISMLRFILLQRRTMHVLYLDQVTGGRNWLYFQTAAEKVINSIFARRKSYAVVNLHLERYQNYCACYGVKAGEELLENIEEFLRARTHRNELYARYEGADYGLLIRCNGATNEEQIAYARKRVRTLMVELMGAQFSKALHYHAGIYMILPVDTIPHRVTRKRELEIDQLYNYANAARTTTHCVSNERIAFFSADALEEQLWERKVESMMETALRNEEFQVYVQPKYSPFDQKLVGGEALVRWKSPTEGLISPGKFIPIFENNGFITKLDDYMISHLAKMQAQWSIEGRKTVPISVNVSRAHFSQENLAEHICTLVDAYGAKHELIELEVTESAFFDDKEILIATVAKLRENGFSVSMDDFGAGYSSLNSLKDIPLDVLKLDGEFFRGDSDERGEIVVKQAIAIAKSLNMRIVAEGIEKEEQVRFLAGQGCDMIQGFYFAKPMPQAEFENTMERDCR